MAAVASTTRNIAMRYATYARLFTSTLPCRRGNEGHRLDKVDARLYDRWSRLSYRSDQVEEHRISSVFLAGNTSRVVLD
jgi:hypothetical protein